MANTKKIQPNKYEGIKTEIVLLEGMEGTVDDYIFAACQDFEKELLQSYKTEPKYFRKNQWAVAKAGEFTAWFCSGSLFSHIAGKPTEMTPPDLDIVPSGKKTHDPDLKILDKDGKLLGTVELKVHPYDSRGSLSWVFKRSVAHSKPKENEWFLFGYYRASGIFEFRWLGKMKDLHEADLFTELDYRNQSMVCVREEHLIELYQYEVEPEDCVIDQIRLKNKLFEKNKAEHIKETERLARQTIRDEKNRLARLARRKRPAKAI